MTKHEIHCAHACKDTCAMLGKALELEHELEDFYQNLDDVCTYPDVRPFLAELAIRHKRLIDDIRSKLQTMEARGHILDDIISSFDKTEGMN